MSSSWGARFSPGNKRTTGHKTEKQTNKQTNKTVGGKAWKGGVRAYKGWPSWQAAAIVLWKMRDHGRCRAVLGDKSLLGVGPETSAGKSGGLGADCVPSTSFVSLRLFHRSGWVGSRVTQHDFQLWRTLMLSHWPFAGLLSVASKAFAEYLHVRHRGTKVNATLDPTSRVGSCHKWSHCSNNN